MKAGSGAPTMADVAARAGVSHQTVSRVLNDARPCAPRHAMPCCAAIAALGYRRNQAARALVTRRSGLIGVIVDELRLYGPASTVSSVAQAARVAGYGLTLDLLWDVTGSSVAAALEHQLSQAVEAVVLVAAHGEMPDPAVLQRVVGARHRARRLPRRRDAPTAGVDQRAGGVMATRHLLELGHRKRRPHHRADRLAAGRRSARRLPRGPRPRRPRAGPGGDRRLVASRRVPGGDCSILDEHPSTTALFVANDQMAIGAMRALGEAGRSIPDDVSVVGFDDIPEASFAQPPLTTIRQDFAALGREAVRLVVGAIAR